jgi:iron(III) transport system ATP-binding protein
MTARDGAWAKMDIEGSPLTVEAAEHMEVGKDYTLVLRPEAASLADEGGLPCEVVLSCFMGSYQNYHVKVGNTLVKLEEHNPKNRKIYQVGERCALVFDPRSVHVL